MSEPTFIDDGRASEIVTVADLLPGDVLLGWQGEPWTFGMVSRVEREARPSYGGDVRWVYTIHYADATPSSYWQAGDSLRRIAKREELAS